MKSGQSGDPGLRDQKLSCKKLVYWEISWGERTYLELGGMRRAPGERIGDMETKVNNRGRSKFGEWRGIRELAAELHFACTPEGISFQLGTSCLLVQKGGGRFYRPFWGETHCWHNHTFWSAKAEVSSFTLLPFSFFQHFSHAIKIEFIPPLLN